MRTAMATKLQAQAQAQHDLAEDVAAAERLLAQAAQLLHTARHRAEQLRRDGARFSPTTFSILRDATKDADTAHQEPGGPAGTSTQTARSERECPP